jgi:hypothetical protein
MAWSRPYDLGVSSVILTVSTEVSLLPLPLQSLQVHAQITHCTAVRFLHCVAQKLKIELVPFDAI